MKVVPLEDDKWRVFLDVDEYRTLLDAAYEPQSRPTRQVRLEIRLMACSLRVDTASNVLYGDFEQVQTPQGEMWTLTVEAKDATDREAATKPRTVYIPDDLMADIDAYAERKGKRPDDPLFSCTTRTIQRDVKRSAANAAVRTGNEDYRKVSAHDLRRYFATHLLFRHEVPPPVVRSLGGWKSDDAMFEYLVLPDDVLFERLRDADLLGTAYDKLSRHDHAEKVAAAVARLADLLGDGPADAGLAIDAIEELDERIEHVTLDVDEDTASDGSSDDGFAQQSMEMFNDDRGLIFP